MNNNIAVASSHTRIMHVIEHRGFSDGPFAEDRDESKATADLKAELSGMIPTRFGSFHDDCRSQR
ncbi:MAG: hypothetical protein ACYSW4_06010 [Planctomycetota bacterium]